MDGKEPIEIELRRGLRELQRKSDAWKRIFPHSDKADKLLEREQGEWSDRLKVERTAEMRQADSDPARINEKFDHLQDGLKEAVKEMGQGREADLTFTMPAAPTRTPPDDMER